MGGGCSALGEGEGLGGGLGLLGLGLLGRGQQVQQRGQQVRLVRLSRLQALGRFPRWPEDADALLQVSDAGAVKLQKAFVVFVSHTWAAEPPAQLQHQLHQHHHEHPTAGTPVAVTASPYKDNPDNSAGDKFRLVARGAALLHQKLAGGLGDCYVWFDFSCLDQSSENPALEFQQHAFEIFKCCDCVLSPLVDYTTPNLSEEELQTQTGPFLISYRSVGWNGHTKNSFLNRAWCRLEMW